MKNVVKGNRVTPVIIIKSELAQLWDKKLLKNHQYKNNNQDLPSLINQFKKWLKGILKKNKSAKYNKQLKRNFNKIILLLKTNRLIKYFNSVNVVNVIENLL